MKLKDITFHFENCDTITISGKHIGAFLVDDIKTKIQRIACNAIEPMKVTHFFAIEIHKDANIQRCQLGVKELQQSTFERFTWGDITNIEFTLVEESQYEDCEDWIPKELSRSYYVHWCGENDEVNEAQSSYISLHGNLYILIAENQNVLNVFDVNEIDEEGYLDCISSLYEIGNKYIGCEEN